MKPRISLLLPLSLALAACSGGAGAFEGKWQSTFGGVSLDLKSDHTAAISVVGIPSEGTWEVQGKNKIIVHGPRQDLELTRNQEGDLSDGLGGRFVRQR